jgi:lysophospholipase L1-like esterase
MSYQRKKTLGRYGQQLGAPSVTSYTFPASVGGVNAVDSLLLMKPEDCLYTFNLMPSEYGSRLRKGYREWAINCVNDETANNDVRTIIAFDSNALFEENNKLFAVSPEGIWDVTSFADNEPILVQPFINFAGDSGYGVWCEFTGDAASSFDLLRGHYLYYADALNGLFLYEESTGLWTVPTGWTYQSGTTGGDNPQPVYTDFPVDDVAFIMVYKQRLWVVLQDDDDAWYLPAGNISGVLNRFSFGSKMPHGGNLQGLYNWSVDAGIGIDDMLVAIGRGGDVIVYTGIDPEGADFTSRGLWFLGETPKSRRIAVEYGPDLYILSTYGIASLANLLKGDPVEYPAISSKISRFLRTDIANGKDSSAWQLLLNPSDGFMQIVTPKPSAAPYLQYNLNTQTGAWGFWEGVPILGASPWQGDYFFGGPDGRVYIYDGVLDGTTLFKDNQFQNSPIAPTPLPGWTVPEILEFNYDGTLSGSFLPYLSTTNLVDDNPRWVMSFDGFSEDNLLDALVQYNDNGGSGAVFSNGGFAPTLNRPDPVLPMPIIRISSLSFTADDGTFYPPTLPSSLFTDFSTTGFTLQFEISKKFLTGDRVATPLFGYNNKLLGIHYDNSGAGDNYISIQRGNDSSLNGTLSLVDSEIGDIASNGAGTGVYPQNESYDDFVLVHIDFDPSTSKIRFFAERQLIIEWTVDLGDGILWFDFGVQEQFATDKSITDSIFRNVQLLKDPINLTQQTPKRIAVIGDSLMQEAQYNSYETGGFAAQELALSGIVEIIPIDTDQYWTLPANRTAQQSMFGWMQNALINKGIYASATNVQGQGTIAQRIENYAKGGSTCITDAIGFPYFDLQDRINAMLNENGGGGGPTGGTNTPVYDIVFIQIGTNDLEVIGLNPQTYTVNQFIASYKVHLDRLIAAGIGEIIIGNIPRTYEYENGDPWPPETFVERYPDINIEMNDEIALLEGYGGVVKVADMYSAMIPSYYFDFAHFNAQGQRTQANIYANLVTEIDTNYNTLLDLTGIEVGKNYTLSYKVKNSPENENSKHWIANEYNTLTSPTSGNVIISINFTADEVFTSLALYGNSSFQGTFYDVSLRELGEEGSAIEFRALTSYQAPQGHSNFSRVGFVRTMGVLAGVANIKVSAVYDYELQNIPNFSQEIVSQNPNRWDSVVWDQATWNYELAGETFISGSLGLGRSFAIAIDGNSDTRLNVIGYDVMFNVGGYL